MKNFTNNILVSIIIPVYNNENFLKDSLKSSINQSYQNLEIIVINDGSSDKKLILTIINSFNDNRVRIVHFDKNKGVAACLNHAIRISNGEFISWLSHDDIYDKNKILKQVELAKAKKAEVIYSNFLLFNENSKKKIDSTDLSKLKDSYKLLLLKDNINGCTFLIKKKIFENIGFFNEKYRHIQDYDMWIRIAFKYKMYHVPNYLVYSRMHLNQSSNLYSNDAYLEKEVFYYNFLEKNFLNNNNLFFTLKYVFSLGYRKYLRHEYIYKLLVKQTLLYKKIYILLLLFFFYSASFLRILKHFIKLFIKF